MSGALLPLPDLDDRRWTDLVDEGRSLIPIVAPAWTDHNLHDPGVTLMEMLAWIAETDIYRADRIPESHLRAFLALAGFACRFPAPARAVVGFALKATEAQAIRLPQGTLLDAGSPRFRLAADVWVQPCDLAGVQVQSSGRFRDATAEWQRGAPIALFGSDPKPGDACCLGFSAQLEAGTSVSLYFGIAGAAAQPAARQRLLDEEGSRAAACTATVQDACGSAPPVAADPVLPAHHSAVVVWEVLTAPGVWQPLEALDDTRSLTLSGAVSLGLPAAVPLQQTGAIGRPLATLRVRFVSGAFDAPPVVDAIRANAAEVVQSVPLWETWSVAPGVVASGTPPAAADVARLRVEFDGQGQLSRVEFVPDGDDDGTLLSSLLDWQPAQAATAGRLILEARRLGSGTGAPNQRLSPLAGALLPDLAVYTVEAGGVRRWTRRDSLRASGPADPDFILEPNARAILFGDGQNGRTPPPHAAILCVGQQTAGSAGNVAADAIATLAPGIPNDSRLGDVATLANRFARIGNRKPAADGTDEEPVAHAEGRLALTLQRPSRAVTLHDCETLALETPGTRVMRAAAFGNLRPAFPCYRAPGFITLIVVPALPAGRPMPSPGLLRAVSAYVGRRHIIGTRIEVVGPSYVELGVQAKVGMVRGQSRFAVANAITDALQRFLDPLLGGPDANGWPLGRDVYVSEILATIARVPGVHHVTSLALLVPGQAPQCNNVCLGPLALTVSGVHQIEVS
jgi:hypothetical protein